MNTIYDVITLCDKCIEISKRKKMKGNGLLFSGPDRWDNTLRVLYEAQNIKVEIKPRENLRQIVFTWA